MNTQPQPAPPEMTELEQVEAHVDQNIQHAAGIAERLEELTVRVLGLAGPRAVEDRRGGSNQDAEVRSLVKRLHTSADGVLVQLNRIDVALMRLEKL